MKRIVASLLILILIVSPVFAVSYLGYNVVGGSMAGSFTYMVAAGRYQALSNGTATSMEMYTGGSGAINCYLGVYDDSSNYPGSLLKATTQFTLSASDAWQGANLTSSLAITSGTYYWLTETCDAGKDIFYDSHTGIGVYVVDAGTLPNPFTMGGTVFNNDISIRLDYTASAAGGSPQNVTLLGVK